MIKKSLLGSALVLGGLSVICAAAFGIIYVVELFSKATTAKERVTQRVRDYVLDKF
ncbi:MAG: hypothetical protein FWD34_06405 [Oscillospiraceae bacterium]|nr:hypothetical protein [Oscillospiraceae bacterium]